MEKKGALAVLFGAGFWGLFWIPLRHIHESGVPGLWAVALILAVSALCALPFFALKSDSENVMGAKRFVLFGIGIGLAYVLYFAALIFTDVIRAIFLFYLLPIWATLTARLLYGTPITKVQIGSICLALLGLYLLLGGDESWPIPRNIGDWFALGSGFFWGLCLTILRGNPKTDPLGATLAPLIFGAIIAVCFALAVPQTADNATLADLVFDSDILILVLLLSGLFVFPSLFGQVWGARFIPSSTASMLTMSEIFAATVSYGIWGETELGYIAFFGGALIIAAAFLDLMFGQEREAA